MIVNGTWLLAYLLRILIMYWSLKGIREHFHEKHFPIYSIELQFFLIPGLTSLCVNILLNLIMFRANESGGQEFLFDTYPVLRLFMPFMFALSLLSLVYGVKLFQDMILLNRERSSRVILENQITSMQLIPKEKGTQELFHYVAGFHETIGGLEYRFHSENIVVDALLNMKYHEIMVNMPDLRLETDDLLFPDTFAIQSYDTGIIVGNALDNAVRACKKLKAEKPEAEIYIKLSSFQKRNMFFLEVENSFNGILILEKSQEFPISDKEHGEWHGTVQYKIRG